MPSDHRLDHPSDVRQQRVLGTTFIVSAVLVVESAGRSAETVVARTWRAMFADNLLGRAAELGFSSRLRCFRHGLSAEPDPGAGGAVRFDDLYPAA